MIKLQDFARQQGVTDRAIQKHLKKYEAELQGLVERTGPNGTWLTDEACEILRSKMKQQPVAVLEEDPRVGSLEERIRELERRLDDKEKMLTVAQQQVSDAQQQVAALQESAGAVALLEAAKMNVAQLEARVQTAEDIAEAAGQETERIKADHQAYVKLVEADIAAQDRCREEAEQRAADLQAQLERLANASYWERRKILRDLKHKKRGTANGTD